ncbi:olfactory receptor 6N1-like isoform X1 [Scyliorhinus canicula]|uniref:olfactory receptor 6N1-like isoform X1 n=1 Tax=Scyliorhinus canicula TaxID=7830 RepID=UPI0018F6B84C|nr:olfactory receptor 6N1-like isoform X1 [Scyliorhinus canicula]XP_038661868.1 olfactory receptor 6N1-like isoform X1 [Scyliorhinus canicula]
MLFHAPSKTSGGHRLMDETDQRRYPVTGFILVGFPGQQELQAQLWALFLIVYMLIVLGNVSVVCMVTTDKRLHAPIYFLIANLAAMDVLLTSSVIPGMLVRVILDTKFIRWNNCFVQMYFFHSMLAAKIFLLTVMAYDRFVAICNPQHYLLLTRDASFVKLAGFTWVLGLTIFLPPVVLTSIFPFCGSNEVYNCFCELLSVTSLICTDTISVTFLNIVLNVLIVFSSFATLVWFYIKICKSFKILSREQKRLVCTCVGHLLILSFFFPSLALYFALFYFGYSSSIIHVTSAMVYVTASPLLSPIIYILAAKGIREKILQLIRVRKVFPHVASAVAIDSN